MSPFSRTDTSRLAEWWWGVDRWLLAGVGILLCVGLVMIFAAGPAAAGRLNLGEWHFVLRQLVFLVPALGLMMFCALLDLQQIRRFGLVMLVGAVGAVILTHIISPEVNGATRWIYIGPLSLQPSEFVKPAFAVVVASLIAASRRDDSVPGAWIAVGLFVMIAALVLAQKDLGQTALLTGIFGVQLVVAGLPFVLILVLGVIALSGVVLAYLFLPHVTSRVDRFLDPAAGDTYQVDKAHDAFAAGGLLGQGPGEGFVKSQLPDAHTDYIFAVAGEEFGALICLALIGLYAFIVLRGLSRAFADNDLFVQLAASGLLAQFGGQAIVNIAVNLDVIPSKGMTLPFVSYGGSSLLALSIGMGFILALTRHRVPTTAPATRGLFLRRSVRGGAA